MSVRRLAEDAVQPDGFAFTDENAAWAQATIRKYPEGRQQSAVIPLLMRAQDQEGWVTKSAIVHVADMLAMPLIRVLEVATFYTQFQLKPVGTRAHVQVCGTTPCMLRGAEDLKAVCRSKIHPEPFHRNEAGTLSWEEVECLGACVNAPMVMVFEDTYEDLTPERLEEIIDLFEAGRGGEVEPGPQNGRHLSAPIGGLTSLTGDYDDLIKDLPSDKSEAPKGGTPFKGTGAGPATTTPPSEAGRPDTGAPETDPTIAAPGKANDDNVPQSAEQNVSDKLTANGRRPGAGRTGGAVEGETGEAERDAAEAGQVSAESPNAAAPAGGTLRRKEAAARAATVPDIALAPNDSSRGPGVTDAKVDLSGKDDAAKLEGKRRATSDTNAGPMDAAAAGDVGPADEAGEKPSGLLTEPEGTADDLKKIKGIGPVIEAKLNELGVFHFRQIAKWSDAELSWVDDYLNFRGRAVRDGWTAQARALQSGAAGSQGTE
ncbi:MAG TPA: NADH-quinone oxidoreductase subunit NuoE [Aurantimonas sp.]|uniref:NADH-quinone oxidoreductase subunit NuoE n=1 Tax=Aurantimonas marianensis TaxID=2920428 RepID=A0A9X2KFA8_9HYPH|nr:NADH-quinone oxidoreductase subunit NuoE [Aurantimonas marianensis]MCP3055286.1 NADH-quinone oxidoreductase subunit NuoE [Aurantimonas marianensis]